MTSSIQRAPVHSWLAHRLSADVAAAIERLARTDDAKHVAVMPDVHLAHEVCVGTVLATSRLIYPNAVGGDIGCGMAAIAFEADADLLRIEASAARLLASLPAVVPATRHARGNAPTIAVGELDSTRLSDPRLESVRRRDGVVQLGTLGRGNHFLEFQADEENRLWLMVHSGSRAIGQAVRDLHLKSAKMSATGLWFLDAESAEGRAYLHDAEWARSYARANRRAMVDAAAGLVTKLFGAAMIADYCFDCDHNHVRREVHFGQEFWVHRKGAAPARAGEAGIIPGSMGTESFHVEGRGCAEALHSSSHGAGRAMSRSDARRKIAGRELERQLAGVWYDHRIADSLRDEAPTAYKDVRTVMRAQRELTRITRRLRPVLVYKSG
jgi:tRNA-splicing ligase RtcB